MHLISQYRKLKKNTPEFKIYNYIIDYFFATLDEDCSLERVISKFTVGNQSFIGKYSQIFNEGYLKHLPLTEADIKKYNLSEVVFRKGDS